MGNYTKGDERAASIRKMANEERRPELDPLCACGEPSTLWLSEWQGTTFYCPACVPEEWK
jgi:hypothetical protein